MLNLLRKKLIKNCDDATDQKARVANGKFCSIVGIILNVFLAGFKLFAGIISNSISIIADSINNLSDMGSSVVNLIGFKMSSKPADNEHPYGHERIEYIGGLIISVIILIVGGELLYNSVLKIISPVKMDLSLIIIIILAVSVIVKLWMFMFYYNVGKKINSISLKASGIDARNDAIATTAVLIGMVIYYFTKFRYIDGIVGILVSLFVIVSGIGLVKESSSPLIGEKMDKETLKTILNDIRHYDIVLGLHDIACHIYGPNKTFMSLHVEVPAKMSALDIHDKIDTIEEEMSKKYNMEIVIHMDPIENDNEEVLSLKSDFSNALKEIDNRLSLHDFRIVRRSNGMNVIFDCIKPRDIKLSNNDITNLLMEKFEGKNYNLVIDYEHSYEDIKED